MGVVYDIKINIAKEIILINFKFFCVYTCFVDILSPVKVNAYKSDERIEINKNLWFKFIF